MSDYPVVYEADFAERRDRLSTLFRLILAIPHLIVLSVLQFALAIAVVVAWFVLLFTGRWPVGLYDFVVGVLRYWTRVLAYIHLVTDVYPPFDLRQHDEYPVRLRIAPPKASYDRAKVLFRIVLAIPVYLIAAALQLVAEIGALLAWFYILATGRQNEGLQSLINLGVAYQARAYAYFALVVEDWPPFSTEV
jgi:Domain of unknown function (DUF4389)